MTEDHKDKGLLVIAPHRQDIKRDDVVQFCREQKINYTVLSGGAVKGDDGNSIPRVFVFDHTGALTYSGAVSGMDDAIEAALEKAPDWILGPGEYTELRKEAASVVARKNFGKTMAKVRQLKEEGEGAEQEEAARLFERLEQYASREWERVEGLRTSRPSAALAAYTTFAKVWKGDEYGDRADETVKELKKDSAFKDAMAADSMLVAMQAQLDEAKPCKFGNPLELATCDKCQEKNSKLVKTLGAMGARILKKYPDTPAAAQVQELLRSIGLQ